MAKEVLEKLDLNKLEAKDGELKIIHRQDEALKVHYETAVALSGTISAPRKFLEERGKDGIGSGAGDDAQQPIKRSHILFNYRDLYIQFKGNENHPLSYSINGKLTVNPQLKELEVNTGKRFSSKELSQHMKFKRFHFLSKEECNKMVADLQSYKAKLSTEIEKEFNNQTGSKRDLYDVKVLNDGKPLGFVLNVPLYIGFAPVKFPVEINIDIQGKEIYFWLESADLVEALQEHAQRIIDEELKFFAGKGYVLIEQ